MCVATHVITLICQIIKKTNNKFNFLPPLRSIV